MIGGALGVESCGRLAPCEPHNGTSPQYRSTMTDWGLPVPNWLEKLVSCRQAGCVLTSMTPLRMVRIALISFLIRIAK